MTTQLFVEAVGLVVIFWAVGIVLSSLFSGDPDHDVDIRDTSRTRLKNQIHQLHKLNQGNSNANHRRR